MWRFKPIFKNKIWGGDRILAFKGWAPNGEKIGESWELSGVSGDESVISSPVDFGLTITQLIEKYGAELMGEKNYERFGHSFPLLIKFIDARDDLSVQVHPDDDYASEANLGSGKNEMWYILDSDKDSTLLNGFHASTTEEAIRKSLGSESFISHLKGFEVYPGDAYYIPAGRVHSVGRGIFLLEIQQASDNTFRIYDYDRNDENGVPRPLDLDRAMEVINFEDTQGERLSYLKLDHVPSVIIDTPYFTSKILSLSDHLLRNYSEVDSFVALICVDGKAKLSTCNSEMELSQGETILISAKEKEVHITPLSKKGFTAVEVFIR